MQLSNEYTTCSFKPNVFVVQIIIHIMPCIPWTPQTCSNLMQAKFAVTLMKIMKLCSKTNAINQYCINNGQYYLTTSGDC